MLKILFILCLFQSVGIDKGDIPDLAKVSKYTGYISKGISIECLYKVLNARSWGVENNSAQQFQLNTGNWPHLVYEWCTTWRFSSIILLVIQSSSRFGDNTSSVETSTNMDITRQWISYWSGGSVYSVPSFLRLPIRPLQCVLILQVVLKCRFSGIQNQTLGRNYVVL